MLYPQIFYSPWMASSNPPDLSVFLTPFRHAHLWVRSYIPTLPFPPDFFYLLMLMSSPSPKQQWRQGSLNLLADSSRTCKEATVQCVCDLWTHARDVTERTLGNLWYIYDLDLTLDLARYHREDVFQSFGWFQKLRPGSCIHFRSLEDSKPGSHHLGQVGFLANLHTTQSAVSRTRRHQDDPKFLVWTHHSSTSFHLYSPVLSWPVTFKF